MTDERWAHARAELLPIVASDRPMGDVLAALCRALEAAWPGASAAVLRHDARRGTLHPVAAPSLPPAVVALSAGRPVGSADDPCGAAARTRAFVVADTADPRWAEWAAGARPAGLRTCWSQPILGVPDDPDAPVLGVIAVYGREARAPEPQALALAAEAAQLAAVAIARARDAEARRHSEERYRLAMEATGEVLADADLGARTIAWTGALAEVLGYHPDDVHPHADWFLDRLHPDDRGHVQALRDELQRRARDRWTLAFRFRHADGTWRDIETHGVAVRDADGAPVRIVGALRDVTARARLQRELVERDAQLQHAQRLEAVGRLAGGLAHDFNNLLTIIRTNAAFALEALDEDDPARADIGEIARATERAAELTRQLLAFARRQVLRPEVVELRAVLEDVVPLVRRLVGGHIAVRLALDPAASTRVRADVPQLTQVLLNLAANARDAMGAAGGTLTLTLAHAWLDAAGARRLAGALDEALPAGRYVTLAVHDTGAGMDAATRARVFEPFFTTRAIGEGTGLGLASVHGVIHQLGGAIDVDSAPGDGSVFTIYLPDHDAAADAALPASGADAPDRVGASAGAPAPPVARPAAAGAARPRVLLAEDEPAVRLVIRRVLERAGYAVVEAADGVEALAHLQEDADASWALLVSDVLMPHIDGVTLAHEARVLHPSLPVVLMSGYSGYGTPGGGFGQRPAEPAAPAGAVFVDKPPTVEALLAAIARAVAAWSHAPAPARVP